MRNKKQHIARIFIILLLPFFTLACGNNKKHKEQEHGDMMENEHQMDGDQEMMKDSTSMKIDKNG
ncbi:hypothetical protein LV84_03224 [Algoriphagus ratkowskyi]|uniref:Uncharacterized protein n=1 Tax=Algoriphagus ratkowskyi TaxID=57028 RepID=A0A2W7R5C4_9BACT|nr:hypothetical protein [Algoriphagus ratkowskyi]PZX53500.1 hypothetical protein LV84_03224 [Algoriphagus ratkowskyi]TXD76468.1 hypothetical protein ESW18_15780 [Algoriphagus ratkowskyi]